ncbi:MAG: hypothetical protein RUMPE_00070 [Eubacteriales bacterium SKADARSKE-1]|nr:hypothetical protein [Eubacteriales bacterium SKADARSKE-1]
MKKILSSVLTITMLISALGSVTVFADGSEPNDSSVTSTKSYVGLAKGYVVSKAKSAIKEVSESKSKYAIIAGGAILSAAAAVAAMYYCKGSNNASVGENLKGAEDVTVDSATGTDTQNTEETTIADDSKLGQSQLDISAPSLKYDEISNVETNAKNASAITATGNDEQKLSGSESNENVPADKDTTEEQFLANYVNESESIGLWDRFKLSVVIPITGAVTVIGVPLLAWVCSLLSDSNNSANLKIALEGQGFSSNNVAHFLANIKPENIAAALLLCGQTLSKTQLNKQLRTLF